MRGSLWEYNCECACCKSLGLRRAALARRAARTGGINWESATSINHRASRDALRARRCISFVNSNISEADFRNTHECPCTTGTANRSIISAEKKASQLGSYSSFKFKHFPAAWKTRRLGINRNTSQSDQTGNSFLLIRPHAVVVLHNHSFRPSKTTIFKEMR